MPIERIGQGLDIVCLHGWGWYGGVFRSLAERLAQACRFWLLDLPGYGERVDAKEEHPRSVEALAAYCLQEDLPRQAVWLGWSLGGLVALEAARQAPERIEKLVLVATTPRFTRTADWPHAVAPTVLAEFAAELERDYHGSLQRFLSLQAASERESLRRLRAALASRSGSPPRLSVLRAGLTILDETDLRAALPRIAIETLVIQGGRDRLVPPEAGAFLAACLPRARYAFMPEAAHAPFLTHERAFIELLVPFLEVKPG
jgi:pimeloyl-[acyl-carrier protein] methyl ester esterase